MTPLEELQAIVSGFVGGATYGVKIRFPHALVMTCLFRPDLSPLKKLQAILKLTYAHAKNLALFAAGYKFGLAALKFLARKHREHGLSIESKKNFAYSLGQRLISFLLNGTLTVDPSVPKELAPPGSPERYHHALIAGMVSASYIWGQCDALNYQVLLYVASRVLIASWRRLFGDVIEVNSSHKIIGTPIFYRLFTGLMWGTAMLLWEETPQMLHPSMKKSMDEIYQFDLFSKSGLFKQSQDEKSMAAKVPRLFSKAATPDLLSGRG